MRMMVVFKKGYDMRFIGHLDLLRTVQRGLRRSKLPIAYSNGFNPHIKLSFAAPLSVGIIGEREMMELPLTEEVDKGHFIEAMNKVMPESLKIVDCHPIEDKFPTLMSLVAGAEYKIYLTKDEASTKLMKSINDFITQESCVVERKTKSGIKPCDIKPFIKSITWEEKPTSYEITLITFQLQEGALKPTLWLDAFANFAQVDINAFEIHREYILSKDKDGNLIPMEKLANG